MHDALQTMRAYLADKEVTTMTTLKKVIPAALAAALVGGLFAGTQTAQAETLVFTAIPDQDESRNDQQHVERSGPGVAEPHSEGALADVAIGRDVTQVVDDE